MARHRRSRHLGAMSSDQTANLMIGAGAVVGVATLAYYFMREPPAAGSKAAMKQTQAALTTPLMQAKKDFVPAGGATYTRSLYE